MNEQVTGLIVKVAELCNLNCSYCYMYNHVDQSYRTRPKFMSLETFAHVVRRCGAHMEHQATRSISMTFHGGEPMLMDPLLFRDFLSIARDHLGDRVEFSMQTNATLVTDEWISVLLGARIVPGVSLDGPPEVHDQRRVYHDGRGSYDATLRGVELLRRAGITPSVLCVIAPEHDGLSIYRHFRSLGFKHMDFLLPEISHDSNAHQARAGGATPLANYLVAIFDDWFEADDPGVTIRLFHGLLRVLMGGRSRTEALGGGAGHYLVVDTDGSIHANDCLKVCEEGLSASGLSVLGHDFRALSEGLPLVYQLAFEGLPVAEECRSCPELAVCGGGSAPNRYSRARGFDNRSVWCIDLLTLIRHVRRTLENHGHSSTLPSSGLLHERHRRQHPESASAPCAGCSIPW